MAPVVVRPESRPTGSYVKNGHPVIDTKRRDAQGHVPTHRLDQPTNRQRGETFDQYEDRVLARRSFSPDTTSRSDVASLVPEVADSTRALVAAAAREGVRLTPAETKRTQERQEMLFQKGRSTPGDVVTWTLTSDHTPGRAIDFIANGDTTGKDPGYRWLQENAKRFGFSVLGSMDPGHVALP